MKHTTNHIQQTTCTKTHITNHMHLIIYFVYGGTIGPIRIDH